MSALLLVGVVVGLRFPAPVQPPLHAALCSSSSRCADVVLMAKKKKGNSKVSKAADKALAALEALEAKVADPLAADAMTPAAPEPIKKKKKKKDKTAGAPDDAPDPFAVPFADGLAPAVPEPLKKGKKIKAAAQAAAATASQAAEPEAAAAPAAAAPAPMTMAERMARIAGELGIDSSLPLAKGVTAANEAMGLEAEGTLAQQVQTMMEQLGIEDVPAAAMTPAPAPVPAPAPPAPEAAPEAVPTVAVEQDLMAETKETVDAATEAPQPEPELSAAEAVVEAVEEAVEEETVEEAEPEVKLSKKKMGKKEKKKKYDDDDGAPSTETDQSGRRQMGGKRIETFADAPPGFAYLKLANGKLRFRQQEVLRGVSWDAQTGQRVGLVGNNGAGKTTQLRVRLTANMYTSMWALRWVLTRACPCPCPCPCAYAYWCVRYRSAPVAPASIKILCYTDTAAVCSVQVLAEELQLDEGELIKSAPDITISFLRQEFREVCDALSQAMAREATANHSFHAAPHRTATAPCRPSPPLAAIRCHSLRRHSIWWLHVLQMSGVCASAIGVPPAGLARESHPQGGVSLDF